MDELIKAADKIFDAAWQFVCKYYLRALFFLVASLIAYLIYLGFIYFIELTYGTSLGDQIAQTIQGTLAFLVIVFCAGFFLFGLFHSFDLLEKAIIKIKRYFLKK